MHFFFVVTSFDLHVAATGSNQNQYIHKLVFTHTFIESVNHQLMVLCLEEVIKLTIMGDIVLCHLAAICDVTLDEP